MRRNALLTICMIPTLSICFGGTTEKSPRSSPATTTDKQGDDKKAKEQKPVAKLTGKVITVEVLRRGEKKKKAANLSQELFEGDKVFTGKRSKAEITMTDKSVIRMGAESEIVISANRELRLPKGRVKFDFKNPAKIRSGSTVKDVKG